MSLLGVWVFSGPDRPRKLQRVQAIRTSLNVQPLDHHALEAGSITPAQLLSLCRQQPAASPARLIVIDQAHRLSSETVQAFVEHAQVIAQVACVVLFVDGELPTHHPLNKELPQVRRESFGASGEERPKTFALLDALTARNVPQTMRLIREQSVSGKEPLELVGLMAWQIQQWIAVRRLLDAQWTPAQIEQGLSLKSWQVHRLCAGVSDRTLSSLQQALWRSWQLDTDAKQGRLPAWMAVEQLAAEVCLSTNAGD